MNPLGQRAVVVGGSIAGMLAARAVAPHFCEVVVIERDTLPAAPAPRRRTPQSYHVHLLLKGGENAISQLVPRFRDEIEAGGSVKLRAGLDMDLASELGFAPHWDAEMLLHSQSRPFLEHTLRRCVLAATPNLVLRCGEAARGLLYDDSTQRVTGAQVESDSGSARLAADFVVDATGRGEMGLRWLRALGLDVPHVDEVTVDFGYASATVELAPGDREWKAIAVGNLPRVGARGGVLLPVEGGRYICSLGGRAGDYPPDDIAGFIEFARSLPQPVLYEALWTARFVSPIARMIYPANRLRRYDRLPTLARGVVPVGDALCSFNPTYGQGMSCAALQAVALADTLRERGAGESLDALVPRYLERAVEVARWGWRQANFNDFLYPTTVGDRGMFSAEETRYRTDLQIAAARDTVVRKLTNEVGHLLIPFERLSEPDVRSRVEAALRS
jgi:flavin-dependent dehydrogenase